MSGVTHSRALGAEEADLFAAHDRDRLRVQKRNELPGLEHPDIATLEARRALVARYAFMEKRGSRKRARYETQVAAITLEALKRECGR